MDFVFQVSHFCNEQNFTLEGEGFGLVSHHNHQIIHWSEKDVIGYSLPVYLFPKTQTGCVFGRKMEWRELLPYYGNPHYKKYIEDNNGECPLPLPEDTKWWELENV